MGVYHVICILLPGNTARSSAWCPGLRSEGESLTDCQVGEMYINLGSVDCLSPEVFVHLLRRNSLIVQVGFLVDEKAMGFACNSLEER